MSRSSAGVRQTTTTGGPPLALPGELARPHLVTRLAARWSVPVTVVVGGAGFGKSTLLAQACRSDAACPPGVERWVACEPRHVRSAELAADVLAALDVTGGRGLTASSIADALRRLSPLDVCVVLDDVHHLGAETSGARLLADLVRQLPANAHLVLASRLPPAVPLARLRAAGRVVELDEHDLAFTPHEVERLAAAAARCPLVAAKFGGWPALVRVALAMRPGAALRFACEEVLADLPPGDRRALLALATVGTADEAFVGRVCGGPVDLEQLAAAVPMVARVDDVRYRAHDLWLGALARAADPDEVRAVQCRAAAELLAAGDVARAGDVAIRAGDAAAFGAAAMELVRSTVSVLPVELARRWVADGAAAGLADTVACRLLAATVRATVDFGDATVDAELDAVADDLRAAGDAVGEVTALAVGTVAAQARGDTDRLVAVALRTAGVPGAADHPIVRLARGAIGAVVAEAAGDPERAIDELSGIPTAGVPAPIALSANRFLMHCLLLAGRATEAVALADRTLAELGNGHSRSMPALARWLAGDPSGFAGHDGPIGVDEETSDRDRFLAGAFHAVIGASAGIRVPFDDRRRTCPRDAAVLANARAALAVLDHDEVAAAARFAALHADHPDVGVVDRHLRRFLALGYVLDPVSRARWDAADLGPAHDRARSVARLLLALRAGRVRPEPTVDPTHVYTVLPLPWSIELACRLAARHPRIATELLESLVEHARTAAHDELRRSAGHADRAVAGGAVALLARTPREPADVTAIGVLGPLQLHRGGRTVTTGELRRQRVRELLAMLVVERVISRDRAIELLWPELDAAAGGRNLRVTLTYLRRVLEPDRAAGEPGYHLRVDATTIRLAPSPKLVVDLWALDQQAAAADEAERAGDVETAIGLLAAATSGWRGGPLTDLDRLGEHEAEIERVRLRYRSCLLRLGELRLTVGDAAGALAAAERALRHDPYHEPAHRLAIAAAIHAGDRAAVRVVLARTVRALDDLGVSPEPATAMLMRSATRDRVAVALAG